MARTPRSQKVQHAAAAGSADVPLPGSALGRSQPGQPPGDGAIDVLKAVGDETRYAIYRLIQDASSPVSAQFVAESLGLHANTVRPHLERLRAVGLLDMEINSGGRVGRPQHMYRLGDRIPPLDVTSRAYRRLAEMLVEMLAATEDPSPRAVDAGRSWGRRLRLAAVRDGRPAPGPLDAIVADLRDLGFELVSGSHEVIFEGCPFTDLAQAYPEVVCSLHLGICEGSVAEHGTGSISAFEGLGADGPCAVKVAV